MKFLKSLRLFVVDKLSKPRVDVMELLICEFRI